MSQNSLKIPDAKPFLNEVQGAKNLSLPKVLRERRNVLDLRIVVLIDISGSISQETFTAFMKMLDKIRGLSMVKVLEFDTDVKAMYDYYKTPQNEVMRLTGGGGTYFGPVFKQAKAMKPDAILIMTDCENFDNDFSTPEIPTAVVLTEGSSNRYDWKVIGTVPNSNTASRNRRTEEAKALDDDMKRDNDELAGLEDEPDDEFEDEE